MTQPTENLTVTSTRAPTLPEIRQQHAGLRALCRETPVWEWQEGPRRARLGADRRVFLKLELLQHAGSFKVRGALTVMQSLSAAQLGRGIVTVSAGNHAMAVGYAARALGTSAKVVMPANASPARVAGARAFGAEVLLVADVHEAFARVREIEGTEGRFFVHPFDGPLTTLGTATLGLELLAQCPELDAIIVPIGGGGLCAGVATAVKLLRPACRVIGVEPEGADTMHRSFASGKCESIEEVRTIADSLGAPHAAPYSFGLCRAHVDELVYVSDTQICAAMAALFHEVKLAVEPAGAATTAALFGPLREQLARSRVALIVCGSNIDLANFTRWVDAGERGTAPA